MIKCNATTSLTYIKVFVTILVFLSFTDNIYGQSVYQRDFQLAGFTGMDGGYQTVPVFQNGYYVEINSINFNAPSGFTVDTSRCPVMPRLYACIYTLNFCTNEPGLYDATVTINYTISDSIYPWLIPNGPRVAREVYSVNITPSGSSKKCGKQVDLSINSISLSQPAGTLVSSDINGNAIIATTPPSNSNPKPATSPAQAQALVNINLQGVASGITTTNVQLKIDNLVVASSPIDISGFVQGNNSVLIPFTPLTDPSFLGIKALTATVNTNQTVNESNYYNNSFTKNINTMVLCKVEDSGRQVNFWSQVDPIWKDDVYGIYSNSSRLGSTMSDFGCSVADLAMLFDSYGIKNVPIGSPAYPATTIPFNPPLGLDGGSLNPGSLNYAMANYTTSFISTNLVTKVGSVGFNSNNDPKWPGAVEIARAGYQAQCSSPSSLCDPNNAKSMVSYKPELRIKASDYPTEQAAIAGIQNEICSGNPVILKFSKARGGSTLYVSYGDCVG